MTPRKLKESVKKSKRMAPNTSEGKIKKPALSVLSAQAVHVETESHK